MRPVLAALLLLTPALAGCAALEEGLEAVLGPRYASVAVSPLTEGEWTTDGRFRVVVEHDEPVDITIQGTNLDSGRVVSEQGVDDLTITLPDGRWAVAYFLDGRERNSWSPVLVDTAPPSAIGLETLVASPDGGHVISASVEGATEVRIVNLATGQLVGTELPVRLSGLDDGLHVFLVSMRDEAGNFGNETVQVIVGDALLLPEGVFDFGIVARYQNDVQIWDIDNPTAFAMPAQARAAVQGQFLGSGHAITPGDPEIAAIVDATVAADMTTLEAALALYKWMYDELEYDVGRLQEDDLLLPVDTLSNGGGVCRDLAALYTSLLRAAGIPARVVSGYLAGNVDGFHAWVEFYGGEVNGQPPWVPVDVSSIGRSDRSDDDRYRPSAALQAFGVLPADYLPQVAVQEAGEVDGWASAMSLRYSHQMGDPPTIRFREAVTNTIDGRSTDVYATLCIDADTLARRLVDDPEDCDFQRYSAFLPNFLTRTQRTIDYGIAIEDPGVDTVVDVWVTVPDPDTVAPNEVEYRFYGPAIDEQDPDTGKAHARFSL